MNSRRFTAVPPVASLRESTKESAKGSQMTPDEEVLLLHVME